MIIDEIWVHFKEEKASLTSAYGEVELTVDRHDPVALHFKGPWTVVKGHWKGLWLHYEVKKTVKRLTIKFMAKGHLEETEIKFPFDFISPKRSVRQRIVDFACMHASEVIWSYTTRNIVRSSPAVADGKVYVGSYDGKVYAFGPYDVTIQAYCWSEGTPVSVNIAMDGSPTPETTPHTFTGSAGSYTFTVPNTDPQDHPFKQWSTGETSTTITVNAGGTYTAHYGTHYNLTITTTTGGTTNPSPRTYSYGNGTIASVTAIPVWKYAFDHWELDGVNVGSAIQITVTMDSDHTLRAIFRYLRTPGGRRGLPLLT